jgi:DNA repair protein RadC
MKQRNKKDRSTVYPVKIKDWPEDDRPREKLLKHGPSVLSDAELMALLIGSGIDGVTAVDLAKKLLVDQGSLISLASADISRMTKLKGIGPACAARLMAAFEVGRRIEMGKDSKKSKMRTPLDFVKRYSPEFRGMKQEVFKVILLNNGNRVIRDVLITKGILNASLVHPREIFKAAVDHLAAGIVLIHNHPSGETTPSQEDRNVTAQLVEAGKTMGIPVIDHLILAGNQYYSFAEEGFV